MPDPPSWDILNEPFDNFTDGWSDVDSGNGVSEISPAGQARFDGNAATGDARRDRTTDIPVSYTLEVRVYYDKVGLFSDVDQMSSLFCGHADYDSILMRFCSDGLFVYDGGYTEVGTNLVKTGGSAEWQIWRFPKLRNLPLRVGLSNRRCLRRDRNVFQYLRTG